MHTTTHASVRQQQRGIPPLIIDWLLQYGEREHDGRGAEIVYFSKDSLKDIRHYAGDLVFRKLDKLFGTYAVVQGGSVITTGHHYKRITRKN
jgi:hypothetical protein